MLSKDDIKNRSLVLMNALEHKNFKVQQGCLKIECAETGETVSKHPFYSLFALFVIGHISITSPVLEHFRKKGVALVILRPNFRLVHLSAPSAEANTLLRKYQYLLEDPLSISKVLIANKIENQISLLKKIRDKEEELKQDIKRCKALLQSVDEAPRLYELSAIEGNVAKLFFHHYFKDYEWKNRAPRTKQDYLNVILDIGYTFLFNFVDCMVSLFGFDTYQGVMHQLWYKRKSLICDLVEPFRCLIDQQIRRSLGLKEFQKKHFEVRHHEYRIKRGYEKIYTQAFMTVIAENKENIFCYVRDYYRCFMGRKSVPQYPKFLLP